MGVDREALAVLAAAQGGVLLTSQMVAMGMGQRNAAQALRRWGWQRLHFGAWAAPGVRVDLQMRARAYQLQSAGLVGSHSTAAAAHGIEMLEPYAVEFTVLGGCRERRPGGAAVHRAELGEHEVTTVGGVRVTTPVRTVCDLLRALPRNEAVVAVDSALLQGLVLRPQVEAALGGSRTLVRRARSSLALTDPRCGSPAESLARLHMHDAGLHPESQVEVTTANGQVRRLDFLFRA